jgi:hypothetical protein
VGLSTWDTLAIPTTDGNYPSTYTGQAKWIAAAPAGALEVQGYIITTTPWTGTSSDDMILQIAQSDSPTDNAFMQLPGGAVRVSAAPGTGRAWVISAGYTAFVSNIGYGYPQ